MSVRKKIAGGMTTTPALALLTDIKHLIDEDTLKQAASPQAKQMLKDNTQEALEKGVFGVPSVVVGGEVFWGFDSFPHLERYLHVQDPGDPTLV